MGPRDPGIRQGHDRQGRPLTRLCVDGEPSVLRPSPDGDHCHRLPRRARGNRRPDEVRRDRRELVRGDGGDLRGPGETARAAPLPVRHATTRVAAIASCNSGAVRGGRGTTAHARGFSGRPAPPATSRIVWHSPDSRRSSLCRGPGTAAAGGRPLRRDRRAGRRHRQDRRSRCRWRPVRPCTRRESG